MTKPTDEQTERELLQGIDQKVDAIGNKLESVTRRAVVAGGLSGSLTGGLVATAICLIKAKMGW